MAEHMSWSDAARAVANEHDQDHEPTADRGDAAR
jgi:hypothetical protein